MSSSEDSDSDLSLRDDEEEEDVDAPGFGGSDSDEELPIERKSRQLEAKRKRTEKDAAEEMQVRTLQHLSACWHGSRWRTCISLPSTHISCDVIRLLVRYRMYSPLCGCDALASGPRDPVPTSSSHRPLVSYCALVLLFYRQILFYCFDCCIFRSMSTLAAFSLPPTYFWLSPSTSRLPPQRAVLDGEGFVIPTPEELEEERHAPLDRNLVQRRIQVRAGPCVLVTAPLFLFLCVYVVY